MMIRGGFRCLDGRQDSSLKTGRNLVENKSIVKLGKFDSIISHIVQEEYSTKDTGRRGRSLSDIMK